MAAQATELHETGLSWGKIAKRLGVTKGALMGKLNRKGEIGNDRPRLPPPRIEFPPPGCCLYPFGDPQKPATFRFCGKKAVPRADEVHPVWCAYHLRRVYVGPR